MTGHGQGRGKGQRRPLTVGPLPQGQMIRLLLSLGSLWWGTVAEGGGGAWGRELCSPEVIIGGKFHLCCSLIGLVPC